MWGQTQTGSVSRYTAGETNSGSISKRWFEAASGSGKSRFFYLFFFLRRFGEGDGASKGKENRREVGIGRSIADKRPSLALAEAAKDPTSSSRLQPLSLSAAGTGEQMAGTGVPGRAERPLKKLPLKS